MDDVEIEIQNALFSYLELCMLDDLFEYPQYNKVVWASDHSISIELDMDSDYPDVVLRVGDYNEYRFDTFPEAVYTFVEMFMKCPSDDTDEEPTYGQIFSRGTFGGVG